MSTNQILSKFNVGTEQTNQVKMPPPSPRYVEELGPLRDVDLQSINKHAEYFANKEQTK
jgi:hypothetical protein